MQIGEEMLLRKIGMNEVHSMHVWVFNHCHFAQVESGSLEAKRKIPRGVYRVYARTMCIHTNAERKHRTIETSDFLRLKRIYTHSFFRFSSLSSSVFLGFWNRCERGMKLHCRNWWFRLCEYFLLRYRHQIASFRCTSAPWFSFNFNQLAFHVFSFLSSIQSFHKLSLPNEIIHAHRHAQTMKNMINKYLLFTISPAILYFVTTKSSEIVFSTSFSSVAAMLTNRIVYLVVYLWYF